MTFGILRVGHEKRGPKRGQIRGPKPRISDSETSNFMSRGSVFHQKSAIFVFFVIFDHFVILSVFF
jgi:hypothetical protein